MLLAVDKPKWITSYDVIRKLKYHFPKKTKIGHSGTLDPMATGLLLIWVGKDTKRLAELQGLGKSYETTIDFAQDTDTWDADFREKHEQFAVEKQWDALWIIKNTNFVWAPSQNEIQSVLEKLVPQCELPLTPFSAKKKWGKKLYELARAGEEVKINKTMETASYQIISYNFPELELVLEVGSGTYIRSIGHWIGLQFGLWGILTSLRRTSIGEFSMEKMDMKALGDTELLCYEI